MNPFEAMRKVLELLLEGKEVDAALTCSPCVGEGCKFCGGSGSIPVESLHGRSEHWAAEAKMVLEDCAPMCMRSAVMRGTVSPIIMVNSLMTDGRFDEAKSAANRCKSDGWRVAMLKWIEHVEKS